MTIEPFSVCNQQNFCNMALEETFRAHFEATTGCREASAGRTAACISGCSKALLTIHTVLSMSNISVLGKIIACLFEQLASIDTCPVTLFQQFCLLLRMNSAYSGLGSKEVVTSR